MKVKLTRRNIEKVCVRPEGKVQGFYWDTELRGFGLVAGTSCKTFVLDRVMPGGRRRRITIGRCPPWTPEHARARAAELSMMVDRGVDPHEEARRRESREITLLHALDEYVSRMRAASRSERSIAQMGDELSRHLGDWYDRPLVGLTKLEAAARHRKLTRDSGPYLANRVMRFLRAVYRSAAKVREDFPRGHPVEGITWNKERRRREPIEWDRLPAFREEAEALPGVLRDFLLVCLLTGARSSEVAGMRWEHLDLDARTVRFPTPKGGADRAFDAPLPRAAVPILERRREENGQNFPEDGGWVFPTREKRKGGGMKPIVERRGAGVSPHRLRDTFASAAAEVGLREMDIGVLLNHRQPGGSVTEGYIRRDAARLRALADQVAGFLVERMGAE